MKKIDDRYLQIAIAAAKEAGRIQMIRLGHSLPVEYKGEFNPVTEVDRLCEQAIIKMILNAFPDHDILTEETPFKEKGSSWKWIIWTRPDSLAAATANRRWRSSFFIFFILIKSSFIPLF